MSIIKFSLNQDKLYKILKHGFRVLVVGAIIANGITGHWLNLFISLLTLSLTFLPSWLANNNIYLPLFLQFINLIFIFATLYLGELKSYYIRFWWWDLFLHTFSGVVLGFLGIILVYLLNNDHKVNLSLSPIFVAIFAFSFTMTIGSLWEIFEFSVDSFFGLNMQKSGLIDTMWDLIVDAVGGLFSSSIGYLYIKKEGNYYFDNLKDKILPDRSL